MRSFLLHKTLLDGQNLCGLLIVMFLSAVWTLVLTAPIHCRGSIGEQFLQILDRPSTFSAHFHIGNITDELPIWIQYSFLFVIIETFNNTDGDKFNVSIC